MTYLGHDGFMPATWVLDEDDALELLAHLVTAARTQVDEATEYGPMRLLTAARRLAERIAARPTGGTVTAVMDPLRRMPLLAVPRSDRDGYVRQPPDGPLRLAPGTRHLPRSPRTGTTRPDEPAACSVLAGPDGVETEGTMRRPLGLLAPHGHRHFGPAGPTAGPAPLLACSDTPALRAESVPSASRRDGVSRMQGLETAMGTAEGGKPTGTRSDPASQVADLSYRELPGCRGRLRRGL